MAPAASDEPPAGEAAVPAPPPVEDWSDIPEDIFKSSPEEIKLQARLIDNDIKVSTQSSSLRENKGQLELISNLELDR